MYKSLVQFLFNLQGRRSLVFSKKLRKIANGYRKDKLSSNDVQDLTEREDDWRIMKVGVSLTHWGLVTPYGDRDLGQHWLR